MEPDIFAFTTGSWRDPRTTLVRLSTDLMSTERSRWNLVASELAEARADTAAALWFAERVIVAGASMDDIRHEAADNSWADQAAIALAGITRIGVTSMGPSSRRIVETLATITAEALSIVTKSAVVARGLEDLGVGVESGDPAGADAALIPVAATIGTTVWTSAAGAAAFTGSARPVVLADPVTDLGAWAGPRFLIAEWMVRVEQPESGASHPH
ncbi:MAG: hypothetical protein ACFCVC_07725 [Acidimicrobiia bacterium]